MPAPFDFADEPYRPAGRPARTRVGVSWVGLASAVFLGSFAAMLLAAFVLHVVLSGPWRNWFM